MSAIAFPSWLSGAAPRAPIAGQVHRPLVIKTVKREKPQKVKRATSCVRAAPKPKAAPVPAIEKCAPLPTIIPSLRARMNELLIRKLDAAIAYARINNQLAARLAKQCRL